MGRGNINILLSSIYHPVEHNDQNCFNKELASFYNAIPRDTKLLSGQDVNSNVGIQYKMFRDVLGQQGLDNRNVKGKDLLF